MINGVNGACEAREYVVRSVSGIERGGEKEWWNNLPKNAESMAAPTNRPAGKQDGSEVDRAGSLTAHYFQNVRFLWRRQTTRMQVFVGRLMLNALFTPEV